MRSFYNRSGLRVTEMTLSEYRALKQVKYHKFLKEYDEKTNSKGK